MPVASVGTDIAVVLGALGIFIATVVGAVITYRSSGVIRDTHRQVVTLNESTIGELAAADETRRAEEIPFPARTPKEQRHIDTAPETEPAQGPTPRLADRMKAVDEHVDAIHHAVDDHHNDTPTLLELVQNLVDRADRSDVLEQRLDAMEAMIGIPRRPPAED